MTDAAQEGPVLDWRRVADDRATASFGGLTFTIARRVLVSRAGGAPAPNRILFELSVDCWFDGSPRFIEAKEDIRAVMASARYWAGLLPQPASEVAA